MNAQTTVHDEPRPALICVEDEQRRASVVSSLEELGYQVQVAADAEVAIEAIRKSGCRVIVIDEAYDAAAPADLSVMKTLNTMSISARRYIFVAMIGEDVKTLDNAIAFSRSVNAVVHVSDLGGLAPILRRAVADNDAFYRAFREVLQAAGKR